MKKRFVPSTLTAALSLVLLTACGESDLKDIEKRELDAAKRAVQQAEQTDNSSDASTAAPSAAVSGLDSAKLELIFQDEFNGITLDSTKWSTALQWGPELTINDEEQFYVDSQSNPDFGFNPFSFDGEALTITAVPTPDNLKASANDQAYLSGALSSANKFAIVHGYIEARMDFPAGAGLWPAFWMLSSEFEGLKPQLFVAEGNGGTPQSVFHNYNYHDDDGNLRSPGQWEVSHEDFADGYHTYGVSWKADELLFYVDGQPRYRIVGENVANQSMYLIANLAVGGVWPGSPTADTELPAELKIDYIRAYRHLP